MDKETKKLAYELKIQKLIEDIKVIMNQPISKAEQSVKIMARLREEYIYAKNSYINLFKGDVPFVTIYLYADEVKPELEEGDVEGTKSNQYCKIYANSFGPFNADEFFKQEKKIVWILKESYMKSGEYEDFKSVKRSSLGKHNQGEEYYNVGWKVIKQPPVNDGNPTMANLIKISKVILEKQGEIFTGAEEEIMNQVMGHICILEVNHFPGLAFGGTDSDNGLLRDWFDVYNTLIKLLLDFYESKVIITNRDTLALNVEGFTLDYKDIEPTDIINFMTSNSYNDVNSRYGYPSAKMFGQSIKPFFNESNVSVGLKRETKFGPIAVYDKSNKIWVGWYHTSARNEMSSKNIHFIGSWIGELISKTGV